MVYHVFSYWISNLVTDNGIFLTTCILLILEGVAVRFKPLLDVKIFLLIIGFLIVVLLLSILVLFLLDSWV